MKRIVHLSDLHFGRDRPELLEPLVGAVNAAAPDLVAISGDLTQRALTREFRAARALLDRLDAPWLSVPGNHDISLHNPLHRLIVPWKRYRAIIAEDLEPVHMDPEMTVLGVNTVNRFAHQSGRFTPGMLERIDTMLGPDPERVRVIVAHHPLEHGAGTAKRPMRGRRAALEGLAEAHVDVVLSGHLHSWMAQPFARQDGRRNFLQVHAGTGLSTRLRGEENDFNQLDLAPGEITVTRHATPAGSASFIAAQRRRFVLGAGGWEAV